MPPCSRRSAQHQVDEIKTKFGRATLPHLPLMVGVGTAISQYPKNNKTTGGLWEPRSIFVGWRRPQSVSSVNAPLGRPGITRWRSIAARLMVASAAGILATQPASAAGPGDDEIRIGNTMPYSGPASAYGVIGKTLSAYFDKVNAEGGVNGRRIRFISYDDAYNPAKTVELVRKLVEQDRVLLMFGSVGRGNECGGPALSELQQGSAAVQRVGSGDVGSAAGISLDHGLAAELPDRRPHLCAVPAGELSARQDCGAVSGRCFRQ